MLIFFFKIIIFMFTKYHYIPMCLRIFDETKLIGIKKKGQKKK